jgi:hypothetical protein
MTADQLEIYQGRVQALLEKLGGESDVRVELDNLDLIKRVFFDETETILVENDHGTEFELTDLTETEFAPLIYTLEEQVNQIDPWEEYLKYKKGFDILNEYFDHIPDEDKENVDERLGELDL